MLGIAYDVRSRRSHVLTDLGEEVWVFTDGAETAFEPNFREIFALAGLWRLVRHVVRRYVIGATKTSPEPWDYRGSLPGIIKCSSHRSTGSGNLKGSPQARLPIG